MSKLLDLEPEVKEQKIKSVIKSSIMSKQEQLEKINKEIELLNKQEKDKVYYVENPTISVGYAILTLFSDVLDGYSDAIKTMKKEIDEPKVMVGGVGEEGEKSIENSKEQLKVQADKLEELIKQAKDEIEKLKQKGPSVSSGKKFTNDAQGQFNKALDRSKDIGIAMFKTGVKWSEEFISDIIELTLSATGQKKILDTPLDELSPQLNKQLIVLAGVLKELATNPATREAIKEIAEAIGITIIEIMEEIKPQLEKVTDEGLEMLDQVSEKAARGSVATGISVAQAVLAEIPWVGGIIDFFLAIGKGFNSLMEVFKTFSDKGGKLAVTNAKVVKGTEDKVEAGIDRIETAVNNAEDKLKEVQDVTKGEVPELKAPELKAPELKAPELKAPMPSINQTTKQPSKIQKAGGKQIEYIPDKRIRNKIQKAGNRLKRTLKIFNKTLPKMKYSLKNNKKRHMKKSKKHNKRYSRKR